ncbi:subtilisin-like protein [Glonium stellatum]|uniref:tripeptidyl-peptidase II n=1 Tax=Glonium stellatum TaxID=574774 RepID=A0A8E2JNP6_9PEZI|nr:subtilisin-like protein [Glonium stellatum]
MDARAVLPVRVGLKQRNLEHAHKYLDEVSNPASSKYGKHWSVEEITKTFAPSDESSETVLQWLSEHGFVNIRTSGALHTLEFEASVAEIERLLKTEYYVYEHSESGKGHVACEEYSVPVHITEHINIITPTLHFDVKPHTKKRDSIPNPADPVTGYHPYHVPSEESSVKSTPASNGTTDLQSCVDQITPACLRALYNIPQPTSTPCPNNSFGIVEYNPNTYIEADLDAFFGNYTPKAVGQRPIFESVNNGSIDIDNATAFSNNGESNLDFQYGMSLVYPQNVTLYQVGTMNGDASDADFIQTKVVSTSWGFNENDLTPAYMQTLCNEYMKLGLQGVSVLFSTADHGVAGNTDNCTDGKFQPDFPATCPYVTAIGATEIDPTTPSLSAALAANAQPEIAINHTVKSGGGFSNLFALPSYQQSAVAAWRNSSAATGLPFSSDRYNSSGTSRAVPDLSANGANYAVLVDGAWQAVDGTSAATPVVAAMVVLVNEARLAAGKPSLGFLNPAIYAHAAAFVRDVLVGRNPGCGTDGFEAGVGWDPVTGLGTPDFARMMDVFVAL